MSLSSGKEARQELEEWRELLSKAENCSRSGISCPEEIVEITASEVLGVGDCYFKPPEVVVVRDISGKVWILEETDDDAARGLRGLVSRHSVRPGMKFRLRIKKSTSFSFETEAFSLPGPR